MQRESGATITVVGHAGLYGHGLWILQTSLRPDNVAGRVDEIRLAVLFRVRPCFIVT